MGFLGLKATLDDHQKTQRALIAPLLDCKSDAIATQ